MYYDYRNAQTCEYSTLRLLNIVSTFKAHWQHVVCGDVKVGSLLSSGLSDVN